MEEKIVQDATIFLTVTGSHAYGTNVLESDIDFSGVCIIPDRKLYFGTGAHAFEQKTKWDDGKDRTVTDVRKLFRLLESATPNMLELLFANSKLWQIAKEPWLQILDNRKIFLSQKVRFTFGGYAHAQLKRIRTHRNYLLRKPPNKPLRSDFGLPEKSASTASERGAFEWLISHLLKDSIQNLEVSEATKEELSKLDFHGMVSGKAFNDPDVGQALKIATDLPDSFLEIMMREKQYRAAMADFESYENWRATRNPKRAAMEAAFGFDGKHALHLVRLLNMGRELLETERLSVMRPEKDELLSIRHGAWTFEQVEEYAATMDRKLSDLMKTTKLPKEPDRKAIEDLCVELVSESVMHAN